MKKLNVSRNPVSKGIELIVGTDRVTVKINTTIDDSELEGLKAFALKVAEKCGKQHVIFRGQVSPTNTGFSTTMVSECSGIKYEVVSA